MKVTNEFSSDSGEPLVYFTGEALLLETIAWPMQKYAPYKKSIDKKIDKIIEAGLMNKYFDDIMFQEQSRIRKEKKKENQEKKQDMDKSNSVIVVLNNDHFQGPYFMLGIGFVISLVAIGVEFIAKKFSRKT